MGNTAKRTDTIATKALEVLDYVEAELDKLLARHDRP
jgi:hypothetical protein